MKMESTEFERKINEYFGEGYLVEVKTKDMSFIMTHCLYDDRDVMLSYGDQDNERLLAVLPYSAIMEVRRAKKWNEIVEAKESE